MAKLDALVCVLGNEEENYCKSQSLQIWLLGYELSDTLIVMAEKSVTFLASKKKIEFLKQLEKNKNPDVPSINFLQRDKSDNDKKNFEKIQEILKNSNNGKTLGIFSKDKDFPGPVMEGFKKISAKFETQDMSIPMAYIMATKDDSEVSVVKKACQTTVDVFSKHLKEQIMDIIDGDKKVKHSKISEGIANAVEDKKYNPNTDTSQLDLCYPAIIQSGGNYKLKFSVQSNEEKVHFGAIICAFGARYKSYCSNIARTFLVNPSEKIQSIYNLLVEAEEHILSQLKEGNKMCDVYHSTVDFVKKENAELVEKLTKNFGSVMGIEFRENSLSLAPNCEAVIKKGMVFNVNIGFSGKSRRRITWANSVKTNPLFIIHRSC